MSAGEEDDEVTVAQMEGLAVTAAGAAIGEAEETRGGLEAEGSVGVGVGGDDDPEGLAEAAEGTQG